MAQKCEACGSADTTTGGWSHTCLICGHKTSVHTADFAPGPRPVVKKTATKKT